MAKIPETPYLELKMLRNCMLNLGVAKGLMIPTDMRSQPNPHAASNRNASKAGMVDLNDQATFVVMPFFDMDKIHRIELKNERPVVPREKPRGMSDPYYNKLCDRAYEVAAEAKIFNDAVRAKIYHYVNDGTLELINDPFAVEEGFEGEESESVAELAETFKAVGPEQHDAKPKTKSTKE